VPPYESNSGEGVDFKKESVLIAGTKENIKHYCNESLKRLDISQIDLYY